MGGTITCFVSMNICRSLTMAALPLMTGEGRTSSVVGLTFDATVAWPKYDWMGVAKAAFESTSRYLARDLGPQGVRVNLIAAGPEDGAAEFHGACAAHHRISSRAQFHHVFFIPLAGKRDKLLICKSRFAIGGHGKIHEDEGT